MSDIERELQRLRDLERQMGPLEEIRRQEEMLRQLREAGAGVNLANLVPNVPMPDFDAGGMHRLLEAQAADAAEAKEAPTARRAVFQLLEEIREFEASLDEHSEVGVLLAPFVSGSVIHVSGIGYRQPGLVVLYGFLDDSSAVTLVQHLSQLNMLLRRAPRLRPEEPRAPIGFRQDA